MTQSVSNAPAMAREVEMPAPIPAGVEHWSENFCFDAFDSRTGVGFWLHCGRWSKLAGHWREQTKIFLPDGSVVLWKTVAAGDQSHTVGGPTLKADCIEPGRVWQLRLSGPGRRTTAEHLSQGALEDGPWSVLDFDITFTATHPAWDLGEDAGRQVWASAHYEQHGSVTGEIVVDGERFVLRDAAGFRDHSRGPRQLGDMRRHLWTHGIFSDGTALALFHMRVGDAGHDLGRAAIVGADGVIKEYSIVGEPPFATELSALGKEFSFALSDESGEQIEVAVTPKASIPSSFLPPYEKLHGVSPAASHISIHETALFTANGVPGVGTIERSFAVGDQA